MLTARTAHEIELLRMWTMMQLKPKTMKARLSLYRMVGGHEATRESIEEALSHLTNASTVGQYMSHLRLTYRALVERELIDKDPTLGITSPRRPRRIPRPLDRADVEILLAQSIEPVRSWVVMATFAGLRAAEISRVAREDLELHDGGYTLRVQGKGGHVGLVPAHTKVVDLMMQFGPGRLWDAGPAWVSEKSVKEFRRLGLDGGIHRCLHTFATRALVAASGDLLVVRDLMRHASVATTQVYTQLAAERPRAVMNLIS
jgi:integrase/recombinase XerD